MCQAFDFPPALLETTKSTIDQLGGENQFDFLLMTLCENIHQDVSLRPVFQRMDVEFLSDIFRNLVHAALETSLFDENARNRLVLKNYALFELGINTKHFTKLEMHFESALHTCWVEGDLFDKCMLRFRALLPIFEEEGLELERSAIANRVVATRILASSSGQ